METICRYVLFYSFEYATQKRIIGFQGGDISVMHHSDTEMTDYDYRIAVKENTGQLRKELVVFVLHRTEGFQPLLTFTPTN